MNKSKFLNKIEAASTISILGHIRPDGDCVGSCLSVYNYIIENYPNKNVDVYLEKIPEKFNFLKGADKIISEPTDRIYDLSISLDCGDTDRHAQFSPIFASAKDTICLDHHKSNTGFGDYFYLDKDASSCCEIVYRHLDYDKISKEVAECIYLGIVHDTGVFKYPSTTEETMLVAGKMITKGARSQYIIDETFYTVSYKQNLLTGEALMNSKLALNNKVIYTVVTSSMFEKYNATKQETDGIVDKIRVTDGVEVAIFIYQLDENRFKFSLRSISYVDVSTIAVAYGGGGHIRAAGFEVYGDVYKELDKILSLIAKQL